MIVCIKTSTPELAREWLFSQSEDPPTAAAAAARTEKEREKLNLLFFLSFFLPTSHHFTCMADWRA
jgi:hypothetical protein